MSEIDPLLAAVEALTKPQTTGVAEKDAAGRWKRVHEVKHDALLTQIRDAVWPSGENNGGAATSPNERVPLDTHMLYEYSKIATVITSWAVQAGLRPTRNPITDLEQWHVATLRIRDWDASWHVRQLRGWEHHIHRLLAKAGGFTIEVACPICGATEWGNMIDGGGSYPIRVEYVIEDDGRLTDHSALCQACRTVWEGYDAIDELATELNEKEGA